MSPEKFTAAMRDIAQDPDDVSMIRRALAHCLCALERSGYAVGVQVLHDRLTPPQGDPS